jgi:hypothetical protein
MHVYRMVDMSERIAFVVAHFELAVGFGGHGG